MKNYQLNFDLCDPEANTYLQVYWSEPEHSDSHEALVLRWLLETFSEDELNAELNQELAKFLIHRYHTHALVAEGAPQEEIQKAAFPAIGYFLGCVYEIEQGIQELEEAQRQPDESDQLSASEADTPKKLITDHPGKAIAERVHRQVSAKSVK